MTMDATAAPTRPSPARRWRSLLTLGVILLVLAIFVLVAVRRPDHQRKDLQPAIGAAAAQSGNDGTVDLATVADFDWDRVYIFLAYSDLDGIRQGLGFDWTPSSLAESALMGDLLLAYDERSLLVFVRGERDVTGWVILNSDEQPPAILIDTNAIPDYFAVFPHDAARFTVTNLTGQLSDPAYPGWQLSPVSPS